MDYLKLKEKYQEVVDKYLEKLQGLAKDIVDKGLVVCDNSEIPSKDILLLTGLNPSGDGNISWYSFSTARDEKGDYWSKKHEQFGGADSILVKRHMAYLDLFPFAKSRQKEFEKAFKNYIDFRFEIVKITTEAAEALAPKLIVHANKGSLYYWGLNPNTFTMDLKNPWLGYNFSLIDKECPVMINYRKRISGKTNGKENIHLFEISGHGLKGKTYFLSYVMERNDMKDWQRVQLLKPTEMTSLWEWCCLNSK